MPSAAEIPPYGTVPAVEMVGPLTLLLSLIRKHQVDVFDIPIAFVTERYLEALEQMESELDIEVGGEFVALAAELLHIKSLMLLPRPKLEAGEEPSSDPRQELVGRLLALREYRDAAEELLSLPMLGRDTFDGGNDELRSGAGESRAPLAAVDVFKLAHSLRRIRGRHALHSIYDLSAEGLSVREKIVVIADLLASRRRVTLEEVADSGDIFDLVTTFVALLEAVRLGIATITQDEPDGEIVIASRDLELEAV